MAFLLVGALADVKSDPEIFVKLFNIGVEFRVRDLLDDAAVLHDIVAVRDSRSEPEVLFHQQNGKSLLLQRADGAADLLDDDRSQALGRFVEQQEARAGAQDTPDRQHLLLAAGELGALAAQPLLDVGKQRENAVDGKTARLDHRSEERRVGKEWRLGWSADHCENTMRE